jgi:restriction system protein
MAVPPFQALMLPVLKASALGEVKIPEVVSTLGKQLNLSQEDLAELVPSGKQTTFYSRVSWSKTYLVQAGLLEITRRGHFKITAAGEQMLAKNLEKIDVALLTTIERFMEFRKKSASGLKGTDDEHIVDVVTTQNSIETPDEIMRSAHRQLDASLSQELLARIMASPPAFFERLLVSLLLSMGFGGSAANAGRALGRSGDDGVDGVIDQDALGLDRVYIQAKRYGVGNNIGSGAIRDFFGSLDRHKASKGLFVTTSTFSTAARETAEFLSKRIVLIDGEHLAKLMIRYNVGCRVEDTLYIKKVDEEFFE